MTMKGKTLLSGHTLLFEGKPIDLWPYTTGGPGVGGCSCGERSETLATNAARKRWHKRHKEEVREAQAQP